MKSGTFDGEPATDHEFAKWLRSQGWDGVRVVHADYVTFHKPDGTMLASAVYDNTHCTWVAQREQT